MRRKKGGGTKSITVAVVPLFHYVYQRRQGNGRSRTIAVVSNGCDAVDLKTNRDRLNASGESKAVLALAEFTCVWALAMF